MTRIEPEAGRRAEGNTESGAFVRSSPFVEVDAASQTAKAHVRSAVFGCMGLTLRTM